MKYRGKRKYAGGGQTDCGKGYIWDFELNKCVPGNDSVDVYYTNQEQSGEYDPMENTISLTRNPDSYMLNHEKKHAIDRLKSNRLSPYQYAPANNELLPLMSDKQVSYTKYGIRQDEITNIVDNFSENFNTITGKVFTPDMMFMGKDLKKKMANELIYNKKGTSENNAVKFGMDQLMAKKQNDDIQLNFRKLGGNIYDKGGMSQQDLYDYLFDDDEKNEPPVTAPSEEELQSEDNDNQEENDRNMEAQMEEERQYDMAVQIAMGSPTDNPYRTRSERTSTVSTGNPYIPFGESYTGQVLSDGKYGAENIGPYGKEIYGQLAKDLGYAPVANSIYRDPEQQANFIAQGIGAKNSWHLTGNAVDIKPADWRKLTPSQVKIYKERYDIKFHNNHYHLEPK